MTWRIHVKTNKMINIYSISIDLKGKVLGIVWLIRIKIFTSNNFMLLVHLLQISNRFQSMSRRAITRKMLRVHSREEKYLKAAVELVNGAMYGAPTLLCAR